MVIKNFNFINIKEKYILIILILFSIFIRIPALIIFGDSSLEYEWKFLVENLVEHNQFGWKNCEFAYYPTKNCLAEDVFLPNLWMPPFYVYYLYFFTFFNLEEQAYINIILFSQIFLAGISVAIFYKINKIFFSRNLSLFSSLLFSIFPLYVYASTQISSISFQVFFSILFFYFFLNIVNKKKDYLSIFIFSFIAGLLMLLRGEFYAILILTLIYFLFLKVNIKKILLIILVSLITISPYLVRNISTFNKATMLESFGYNIWKGNHPEAMKKSLIVGAETVDENLKAKLDAVPRDKFLRINFDKIFMNEAINNIKDKPLNYLILFFKKATSYILIDIRSPDQNYYNPLNYLPILILGITSLLGIFLSYKKPKEFYYFIIILFAYVFIFSTVSVLPRYKLVILPMQIMLTNVFLESIKKFLISK